MDTDGDGHVITGRRVQKMRQRAHAARQDGKAVALLTVRDAPTGTVVVLFVHEPGQAGPAWSYFPQRRDEA